MGEIVRTSRLVAEVEGNFTELTLEVGRRLQLDDVVVAEWTCDYGDGRLYRNVTIGELENGQAVRVSDYWGEPTVTPEWLELYSGGPGAQIGSRSRNLIEESLGWPPLTCQLRLGQISSDGGGQN